MKPLNEERSELKHKTMNSKFGFSYDELKQMTDEQMKTELNNVVTIESIEKFPPANDTVLHHVRNFNFLI